MAGAVLVTGASSGFGAAIARSFRREGRRVILLGRRRERLEQIAAEAPDLSHSLVCDVSDSNALGASLAALPPPFREIDILVDST